MVVSIVSYRVFLGLGLGLGLGLTLTLLDGLCLLEGSLGGTLAALELNDSKEDHRLGGAHRSVHIPRKLYIKK